MIVSLRKVLFFVLMTLTLLAGTLGLRVRAITVPPTHIHHIVCPPPPYDC